MIEIPEADALSRQLSERCGGMEISSVVAGHTPHKLAWFYGDRAAYNRIAAGKVLQGARAVGGMVEGRAGEVRLLFSEGTSLRLFAPGAPLPAKHQLLVRFADETCLVATVQMYGGMGVFREGENENPYYLGSQRKPSPLSAAFDETYFRALLEEAGAEKLSAKALLATEQRVPGLGNGVLQDILLAARINPRTRLADIRPGGRRRLFQAVKRTLKQMADCGGRDTERDLDGKPGGYVTRMSRATAGTPCPACGTTIVKAAYLGGSVYFCPHCQPG
jgi:formamidopyrimidine-DNA glycosylase